MNNTVMIKSFKNGINIKLDPAVSFDVILSELEEKLKASAKFFGDARLVISFEGRELTDDEERSIVDLITGCTDVVVTCIAGMDEQREIQYIKAANGFLENSRTNAGRFYKGSVKAGETIETDSSIIILGDVNNGGAVNASGNIIILGTLYGHVHAGCFGDASRFVVALDIKPTRVRIADFSEMLSQKTGMFLKNRAVPKIIFVKDDRICAQPVNADTIDSLPV
ncbi:MAG: hypothetical protein IKS84_03835 [Lachnospiraceae bacterium]|nr:hypothetical protein [Lachnospiraceae bacterium]